MEGDVFQVSEDLKEKDLNLQSDEPGDCYFCIYDLVVMRFGENKCFEFWISNFKYRNR